MLRKEEPGEERGAQSSASKLALRCAMGAVDLHKAMQSRSAGGADNSEVLLSGAREMRSLSDAQLMHGDPQMQVSPWAVPTPLSCHVLSPRIPRHPKRPTPTIHKVK